MTEEFFIEELNRILNKYDKNTLKKYIEKLKSKDIFIYGCGNAGTSTYSILKGIDVKIKGFIDKKAIYGVSYLEEKVLKIDELKNYNNKRHVIIIISFLCSNSELLSITKQLNSIGFIEVVYFHDIFNAFVVNSSTLENSDFCLDNKMNILEACKDLNDIESKKIFIGFLRGILYLDSSSFENVLTKQTQYFPDDICFTRGYSRFIDCGAFNGDTAKELKNQKGEIEALACFEPDMDNFGELCDTIRKERIAKEQILIPCGSYSQNQIIKFSSGFSGSSEVSEDGNSCIQGARIDDILIDFRPTFLKMDIEGSEYNTLLGAKKVIEENLPDLAICVYHKVEDLWRIILLIKQYNTHYKFFLRSYGIHGMETVLYATNSLNEF